MNLPDDSDGEDPEVPPRHHSLLVGVMSGGRRISGRHEASRKRRPARRKVRVQIPEARKPVLLEMTGRETTETTLEKTRAGGLLAGNFSYWRGDSLCEKTKSTVTLDRRKGDKTATRLFGDGRWR